MAAGGAPARGGGGWGGQGAGEEENPKLIPC